MPQNDTSNHLATLTLEAVRALLRQIASDTTGYPGGEPTSGTYASLAAQALRDLLQAEPLSRLVSDTIRKEKGE